MTTEQKMIKKFSQDERKEINKAFNKLKYLIRAHGQWFPGSPKQPIWLFVHAGHWNCMIIWHFINVHNILHAGYEFCVFFWSDAPAGIFVRLEFIFLAQDVWHPFQLRHPFQDVFFLPTAAESNGNVLSAQGCRPSG